MTDSNTEFAAVVIAVGEYDDPQDAVILISDLYSSLRRR
jgi:hypothetical protein